MANQTNKNPWSIDTASATAVSEWDINVLNLSFTNYDNANDVAVVTDKNGNPVWNAKGNADLSPVENHAIGHVQGLIVSTLSSGYLMVYFE